MNRIAAETVLITALLYYFGWARTQATYDWFGVNVGLLELSTADYVMRSLNAAFIPLIGGGIALLTLTAVHHRFVLPRVSGAATVANGRVQATAFALRLASMTLFGLVVLSLLAQAAVGQRLGIALPLVLVAAPALLLYSDSLAAGLPSSQPQMVTVNRQTVRLVVLAALIVAGVLWAVTLYAQQTGRAFAHRIQANLAHSSEIVVYSSERLALAGPGVSVAEIDQQESRYRFRYHGLRLLIHSGDRYALLPAGWQRGRDAVYFLPSSGGDIRIDVMAR